MIFLWFLGFWAKIGGFLGMEIEKSGDFGVFGVFEVCLELQRGQVV